MLNESSVVNMNRDYSQFPDDASGDALWHMVQQGDDLSKIRDVEFIVAFPTENEALKFGEILLYNRQKILLCDNPESEAYPYEIAVTVTMSPNYQEITEYENLLLHHASELNGRNDGWACSTERA